MGDRIRRRPDCGLARVDAARQDPVGQPQLGLLLLPRIRNSARLDVGLGVGVARLRCRHDRRIHDLTTHRPMAGRGEVLVKSCEKVPHRPGMREVLAKQSDRLGVRHAVARAPPRGSV